MRFLFALIISCIVVSTGTAQQVYKTPSGKKYHLSSCRMVENVSKGITIKSAVEDFGLEPCKICKPPIVNAITPAKSNKNKAVGECKSQQCKGKTKRGTRCKHKTRLCNGYCFQHNPKEPN